MAIRGDDSFANLVCGHTLFLKVMGHQCFSNADAAVLTVVRFKATEQTLVIVASVAMAIAGQLGQRLGNLLSRLVSQFGVAGE